MPNPFDEQERCIINGIIYEIGTDGGIIPVCSCQDPDLYDYNVETCNGCTYLMQDGRLDDGECASNCYCKTGVW